MELKDPKKPTKKYIKSVLESEYLIANVDAIEQCLCGWMDAVKSDEPVETARKLQNAFNKGDLWSIGYCTYTYGYALQSTAQPNKRMNPTTNRVVLPTTYHQLRLI